MLHTYTYMIYIAKKKKKKGEFVIPQIGNQYNANHLVTITYLFKQKFTRQSFENKCFVKIALSVSLDK